MTNEDLRAAVIAALRRRGTIDDLDVTPSLTLLGSRTSTASVVIYGHDGAVIDVVARAGDDAKALRGVAFACGLREDGGDPAEEVERLTSERALIDAEWRRDMDDLRAQMERVRHEAAKDYDESARLRADNARLDDVARGALDDLARVRAELDAARAALDRAHHAVREHGPRCSHPECDALAPLRCDDCGRRFCDEHDDGLAGHDPGFGPQAHAVGPDDLMAGAAMRAAGGDR